MKKNKKSTNYIENIIGKKNRSTYISFMDTEMTYNNID